MPVRSGGRLISSVGAETKKHESIGTRTYQSQGLPWMIQGVLKWWFLEPWSLDLNVIYDPGIEDKSEATVVREVKTQYPEGWTPEQKLKSQE